MSIYLGAAALVAVCAGMISIALYQRWIIGFIDPDPELLHKVLRLRGVRPFGDFKAVRELLDQAVVRGGNKPI